MASSSSLPLLRQLCARAVANRIVEEIEDCVLRKLQLNHGQSNSSLDAFYDCARITLSKCLYFELPIELLRAIQEHVSAISPQTDLFLGTILSAQLDSLCPKGYQNCGIPVAASVMTYCASKLQAGLRVLKLNDLFIGDKFLLALSRSDAAQTLQVVSLSAAVISDASAEVWPRFIDIKELCLDACKGISSISFESIAKLASLERISLAEHPDSLLALQIFLRPENLPNIAQINIAAVEDPQDSIIQLLRDRPHRERLERLRGIMTRFIKTETLELSYEVHQLCPNLQLLDRELFSFSEFSRLSSQVGLSHLTDLSIRLVVEDEDCMKEFIGTIVDNCPSLNALSLRCVLSHIKECGLDRLTGLETLSISNALSVTNIRKWPPSLKTLSISTRFNTINPTPEQITAWVANLCAYLPNLEHLKLIGGLHLTSTDYMSILAKMPYLKVLVAVMEDEEGEFTLSHHNLIQAPSRSQFRVSKLKIGYMPNAKSYFSITAEELDVEAITNLMPHNLPELQSMHINIGRYTGNPESKEVLVDRALDSIASFSATLTQLTLTANLLSTQVCKLSALKRLQLLSLSDMEITEACGSELLESLPWIAYLSLATCRGHASFSWIKHPRLVGLTLFLPQHVAGHAEFSGADLPSLRDLSLSVALTSLTLGQMENLSIFAFNFQKDKQPVKVAISDCPDLTTITLHQIHIQSLKLKNTPMVHSFWLNNCSLVADAAAQPAEIDYDLPLLTEPSKRSLAAIFQTN